MYCNEGPPSYAYSCISLHTSEPPSKGIQVCFSRFKPYDTIYFDVDGHVSNVSTRFPTFREFHTYSIERTPYEVSLLIDGDKAASIHDYNVTIPTNPMNLKLILRPFLDSATEPTFMTIKRVYVKETYYDTSHHGKHFAMYEFIWIMIASCTIIACCHERLRKWKQNSLLREVD